MQRCESPNRERTTTLVAYRDLVIYFVSFTILSQTFLILIPVPDPAPLLVP